jgi:hypothetical protein
LESRTFDKVDAALWQRLQATGQQRHGTQFEETQDNCGTATTPTPIGSVVLGYSFDPDGCTITYTIIRKPMLAASGLIWNGIAATIEGCRRSAADDA